MKRVAIIGGGYTGLACAKRLIDNGYDVTIFEKTDEVGGIAKCINCYNTKIEKHYRHIFKSDKEVIELLKEFDLKDKLVWNETKMAYYSKSGLYVFGTPIALLKYNPLSFFEKIVFGFSIIKIKLIKNYKKIENFTAEEWIKKNCGDRIYKKIWEPLLITKFGNKKNKISMAWLWGKINLRGSSSTLYGEKLGYLEGSWDEFTNKLYNYLINKGCKIKLNTEVKKVFKRNNELYVHLEGEEKFDFIVNTVAYDISKDILKDVINKEESLKMNELEYTSAKTLIIYSKKSLTPFYWINIGDRKIPFGGIIEHTNMIDKKIYENNNIIYISNYMYKNDKMYMLTKEELFELYYPFLKKINNNFNKHDVIKIEMYEEIYAQPVITINYSKKMLNKQLIEDRVFMATMAQIYPEDRGMNYAIKTGYDVANLIINYGKNKEK